MVLDTSWSVHSTSLARDKHHMDLITAKEPKHKNKIQMVKTGFSVTLHCILVLSLMFVL